MSLFEIVLLSVSLAMDAFAVAVAMGATLKKQFLISQVMLTALFFGGFQALMPVAGWLSGSLFVFFIKSFGHWIAFALLLLVGGKMLWEAVSHHDDDEVGDFCIYHLTALAVATSLDAFAVGVSFACMNYPVVLPCSMIGGITFLIALSGCFIGKVFGHLFENKFEILGGVVLILLGFKMLLFRG